MFGENRMEQSQTAGQSLKQDISVFKTLADQIFAAINRLTRFHIRHLAVSIDVPANTVTLKGSCGYSQLKIQASSAARETLADEEYAEFKIVNHIKVSHREPSV